jgi:hypothetical protein
VNILLIKRKEGLIGKSKILRNTDLYINGNEQENQYFWMKYDLASHGITAGTFAVYSVIFCAVISLVFLLRRYFNKYIVVGTSLLLLLSESFYRDIFNIGLNSWCYEQYLKTYKYGFLSQALPASIIFLFTDYFTGNAYRTLMIIIMVVVFVLELIFWHSTYEDSELKEFELFYILTPCFLTTFMNLGMFGKLDVIVTGIYIFCCIIIKAEKGIWLLPVLMVCGCLTHQQFCFEYFPLMMLMLARLVLVEKKQKFKYPAMVGGAASVIVSFITQFVSKINVTFDELIADIQLHTDMVVEGGMYKGNHYSTLLDNEKFVFNAATEGRQMLYVLIACIIGFPILWYMHNVFNNLCAVKDCETKEDRLIRALMRITPVFILCSWVIAIDWARYALAYGQAFFFTFLTLAYKNDRFRQAIAYANGKCRKLFGQYWLVLFACYALICGVGEFGACTFYDRWNPFFIDVITRLHNICI